jgi:hypothetical protein
MTMYGSSVPHFSFGLTLARASPRSLAHFPKSFALSFPFARLPSLPCSVTSWNSQLPSLATTKV